MSKDSKIATALAAGLIAFGVLVFLWILPFLYVYIGMVEQGQTGTHNTKWDKLAVEFSLFYPQKVYTIEAALPGLLESKDYCSVIKYYKRLEKINAQTPATTYLATYAYIQDGDFENALYYAKKENNLKHLAKIYILTKDYKNAQIVVDKMLAEESPKPQSYLYKAELESRRGNYKVAKAYIDRAIIRMPRSVDALQVKANIEKKLGNKKEYKRIIAKIKELEIKNNERIK